MTTTTTPPEKIVDDQTALMLAEMGHALAAESTPWDAARFGWSTACRTGAQFFSLPADRAGWVYIAGPMSGYVSHNFPAFDEAARALRTRGWRNVINPADHGEVEGAAWGDYLRYDLAKLARCEAIFLLDGWAQSRGARLEYAVAHALGLTIYYEKPGSPTRGYPVYGPPGVV